MRERERKRERKTSKEIKDFCILNGLGAGTKNVDRISMAVPVDTCVLFVSWSHISSRGKLFREVLMPKTIISFSVRGTRKEITNTLS